MPRTTFTNMRPEQFLAHVAKLPDWAEDDDPKWVRPLRDFGQRSPFPRGTSDPYRAHASTQMDLHDRPPPMQSVPLDQVRHVQSSANIAAVAHYVKHPHELYDPDGWMGTDHPVGYRHPQHGVILMDGNSRTLAARIRGDSKLDLHLVPGSVPQHHIDAVREHEAALKRSYAQHNARLEEVHRRFGGAVIRSTPEGVEGWKSSVAQLNTELDGHKAKLHAALRRR